jgi:hypothetical protein
MWRWWQPTDKQEQRYRLCCSDHATPRTWWWLLATTPSPLSLTQYGQQARTQMESSDQMIAACVLSTVTHVNSSYVRCGPCSLGRWRALGPTGSGGRPSYSAQSQVCELPATHVGILHALSHPWRGLCVIVSSTIHTVHICVCVWTHSAPAAAWVPLQLSMHGPFMASASRGGGCACVTDCFLQLKTLARRMTKRAEYAPEPVGLVSE